MVTVAIAGSDARRGILPGPLALVAWADQDDVRYPIHAALGTVLNRVDGRSSLAATQWVKAAAHVRSQAELRQAAGGIAAALESGGAPVEAAMCAAAVNGSPSVQVAIALGGAPCAARYFVRTIVPDRTPIEYGSHPPIGGPYYASAYPRYGVAAEPVPAGRWLNNLALGAVVLLYKCPDECPDLVAELRALYASLPSDRGQPGGAARLLITTYPEMERPLAVVAWGFLIELDRLEPDAIVAFYNAHVERAPD